MEALLDGRVLGLSVASFQEGPSVVCAELEDIDRLVATYWAKVLRFVAFSVNDEDLAKTITQDCFLKAYNNRDSFRGDSSVSTWIISIANNLIRDHVRRTKFQFWRTAQRTALDVSEMASLLPSGESSVERRMIARERAVLVKTVLDNLSVNQRQIFLMKFFEEMEVSEISKQLGMPENTVKTHLHRATSTIRQRLGAK